ncbi:ribosomal L21, mitochondrial [Podarcis lilfordi]|uniref:Large ribosomal subunit protein bL21m n=1 Tax=Podarcis lilfordi TaxID=74358 RepID=A0AA35NT93_9SAUR|nr:ribosomal L21, mitochondrial [Podarcis lilfordi]
MAAACALAYRRLVSRAGTRAASLLWSAARNQSSQNTSSQQRLLPKTSLTSPPYPEIKLPDPLEETEHHREIFQKVNELIATGQYGRLFAVVHFASRQWKVTSEDLILLNNDIPAECGDRIRMEKVSFILAIALSSCIRHISLVSSFFEVIAFPLLLDGCQIGC